MAAAEVGADASNEFTELTRDAFAKVGEYLNGELQGRSLLITRTCRQMSITKIL